MPCNRLKCWCCGNHVAGQVGFEFEEHAVYAYAICAYCEDVGNYKPDGHKAAALPAVEEL